MYICCSLLSHSYPASFEVEGTEGSVKPALPYELPMVLWAETPSDSSGSCQVSPAVSNWMGLPCLVTPHLALLEWFFSILLHTFIYKRDFCSVRQWFKQTISGKTHPLLSHASASIAHISKQFNAVFPIHLTFSFMVWSHLLHSARSLVANIPAVCSMRNLTHGIHSQRVCVCNLLLERHLLKVHYSSSTDRHLLIFVFLHSISLTDKELGSNPRCWGSCVATESFSLPLFPSSCVPSLLPLSLVNPVIVLWLACSVSKTCSMGAMYPKSTLLVQRTGHKLLSLVWRNIWAFEGKILFNLFRKKQACF